MNRRGFAVVLQHEYASTFRVAWIVLDQYCMRQSLQYFSCCQVIVNQFVITMFRDSNLACKCELFDCCECVAHVVLRLAASIWQSQACQCLLIIRQPLAGRPHEYGG